MVSRQEFDGLVDKCIDMYRKSGQDQTIFFQIGNADQAYTQFCEEVGSEYTRERFDILFGTASFKLFAKRFEDRIAPFKGTSNWDDPGVVQTRRTYESFNQRIEENYSAFTGLNVD